MWKVSKVIFVSVILSTFCAMSLSAQQWTDEQLEVWKSVKAYSDLSNKGDVEGFLTYYDESFIGWPYGSDATHNKTTRAEWVKYFLPLSTALVSTITPEAIWVKDNFAFVHYYYSNVTKDKDGKISIESGRWTDILMKKGDRWVMIGDHGGQTSK
jgi:ketosteroid isomerase-like protein